MAKERIPITTIDSTYSDGDVLYGYDVNRIIDVFREAANANKLDINKLLTGLDYEYVAEDIFGLQQLSAESTPLDGQNGFIFNGDNTEGYLELYRFNGITGAWDFVSNISLLNPYTETISIGDHLVDWNAQDGTLQIALNEDVTLQLGQEQVFYAKAFQDNIPNGAPVMFAGVEGDHFRIKIATPEAINAAPEIFIGVATEEILAGEFGYVTEFGFVRDFDTTGFVAGDILWFDSTNGGYTTTKPLRDKAQIRVAAVVKQNQNENQLGMIFVRPAILEASTAVGVTLSNLAPTINDGVNGDLWVEYEDAIEQFILDGGAFTTSSFQNELDGGLFTTSSYDNITDGGNF